MSELDETHAVGRRRTRSVFLTLGVVGLVVVGIGRCSDATSQLPHKTLGQTSPPVALEMAAPIRPTPVTTPPPATTTTTTTPAAALPARPSPGCAHPIGDEPNPPPLVVVLDAGSGDPGAFVDRSRIGAIAQAQRLVVVAPRWSGADDEQFVADAIVDAGLRTCIDLSRVYLMGFSGGAMLGSRIVCTHPELVTAFVAVAGLLPPDGCAADVRVPVLALQGELDEAGSPLAVVDASKAWARQNGCEPESSSAAVGWDIQYFEFRGCENAADVQLYLISDMGHEWPERPDNLADAKRWVDLMSTTTIALTFCESHAR